jgi:hypothetical protein
VKDTNRSFSIPIEKENEKPFLRFKAWATSDGDKQQLFGEFGGFGHLNFVF